MQVLGFQGVYVAVAALHAGKCVGQQAVRLCRYNPTRMQRGGCAAAPLTLSTFASA